MDDYSRKERSLWLKFEMVFLFMDVKVILLTVMLFNFYKETVLLADVANPKVKILATELLYGTWQRAGAGYWKWIIFAVIADIFVKRILRSFNE